MNLSSRRPAWALAVAAVADYELRRVLGVQGIALASTFTQLSVVLTLGLLLRWRLRSYRRGAAAAAGALDGSDAI
ncbi:MAG: hypothetical protein QM757_33735 [Paludibaculum sp.]